MTEHILELCSLSHASGPPWFEITRDLVLLLELQGQVVCEIDISG